MKRTRRVEIIRYSRRSALISNEESALEPEETAEQAAIDVLLRLSGAGDPQKTFREPHMEALRGGNDPDVSQRNRLLRFLKRLIQR